MIEESKKTLGTRLRTSKFGQLFISREFFHYFWTGGLFTVLNIFLVWLFIDVLHISTLLSSTIVIGGLFIGRFLVYRFLKVM